MGKKLNRLQIQILLVSWITTLSIQLIVGIDKTISINFVALFSFVLFITGLASTTQSTWTGSWSPASLFLVVLSLFHLGLVPFWIFELEPNLGLRDDHLWFNGPSGAIALQLVNIGMSAYIVGVLLICQLPERPVVPEDSKMRNEHDISLNRCSPYKLVGPAILLSSVITWTFLSFRAGGIGIFTSSYHDFLAASGNIQLGYVYMLIGVGLGLTLAQSVNTLLAKSAIIVFLLFALFAFFLGLRGEVLFPSVVGLSVLAFRKKMPHFVTSLFIAVGVLSLINAAKEVRKVGISASDFSWTKASPLSALGELGSSIRVVAAVVDWHYFSNNPYRKGDTYTVALARFWESISLSQHRVPAELDYRLMNVEVADRAGNIGGSIIAEAFHNFATGGVVTVMLITGLLFGLFSMKKSSFESIGLYVILSVPLFNHIRNSFVPVIPYTILGLLLLLAIFIVSSRHVKARISAPSVAGEPAI